MTPAPAQHDNGPPRSVAKVFDDYAQDYDEYYRADAVDGRSFDYRNRQQVALRLVDRCMPPQSRLLEFGCGAGHTAVELGRRGHQVLCVDISDQMVAATRRTLAAAGQSAEVLSGTVDDVPLDRGPFDGVLALGVMDYVPQPEETLVRVAELLKPGGCCVLSFANAGTPLFWIEMPVKRAIGLGLYALTRRTRFWDVAFPGMRAFSRREVRALYEQAGLQCEIIEYFGFGLRVGSFWIPPFSWVRRWDARLGQGAFRWIGRGFVAVGRKPA